jgi:hypothetical protein
MAPCCDAGACPGGAPATCPTGSGAVGDDGAAECPAVYLLWMRVTVFAVAMGVLGATILLCFCCGNWRGRRMGARYALRNYAKKLSVAATAPQIGSYTSALAADSALDDAVTSLQASPPILSAPQPAAEPSTARNASSAAKSDRSIAVSATRDEPPPANPAPRPPPVAPTKNHLTVQEPVGLSLVDLHGVHSDEARLVPPSPQSSVGSAPSTGEQRAPVMHLSAMQDAEGEIVPPSTAGGSDDGGGVEPQPPTPPRRAGAAPQGSGEYVGTCLVQVPDAEGRWAPVKISASMQGSPVGSLVPSLVAPSESTIGGRSRKGPGMRRGGTSVRSGFEDDQSIAEEDEESLRRFADF